jgi:hypothetical protein
MPVWKSFDFFIVVRLGESLLVSQYHQKLSLINRDFSDKSDGIILSKEYLLMQIMLLQSRAG